MNGTTSRSAVISAHEIDKQGVSTDLQFACRALKISKSAGYASAANGTFPCPVIRVGARYVVPTAGLKAVLGLSETAGAA